VLQSADGIDYVPERMILKIVLKLSEFVVHVKLEPHSAVFTHYCYSGRSGDSRWLYVL